MTDKEKIADAANNVENQRKSYLTLLEIQHLKMMSYRCII